MHSSSLRLGDQHRKRHGWLLFFAVPALQPDRPAAVHPRTWKQRSAKRWRYRVLETCSSKLAGFVDDEGWDFTQSHACLGVPFFSLLDHGSPQATRTNRDDNRWFFFAQSCQRPEVKFSFQFFMYHHQKCFVQPGDHHICQASNTGSALKKKGNFQKILEFVVGVRKKMPGDWAEFSKRAPRHRQNQKPKRSNVWRQILQKRGKQKTFRNEHNSGKKKDIFELRIKIVPRGPRPKHSGVAESLPRPQLVIHPWRIYPSYGHWDDHFDDGYIRHMALNGLT